MAKRTYVITKGEYSDYHIRCILIGEDGADFQALYDEFYTLYHQHLTYYDVPYPYSAAVESAERQAWYDGRNKFNEEQNAYWNSRGYEGTSIEDWFESWLMKDKGFELIEYMEFNHIDLKKPTINPETPPATSP